MAEIERKTKRYPTDLTDEEWARVEPFLPKPAKKGRRREVDFREVLNAIRYLARTGCGRRPDDPRGGPHALAVAQASLRRRRLR
jgi:transposase